MSWSDPIELKKSTDEVLAQIPGLEGFVESVRRSLTDSVQQIVTQAMAGLADGISQMVRVAASVDGTTVDLEIEPIILPPILLPTIPAIRAKLVVHMPLWKDK